MLTARSMGERVPRVRRALLSLPQPCLLPCVLSAGWEDGKLPGSVAQDLDKGERCTGRSPSLETSFPTVKSQHFTAPGDTP